MPTTGSPPRRRRSRRSRWRWPHGSARRFPRSALSPGSQRKRGSMRGGAVDTLVVTATNPVFTAPYDLNFAKALDRVPNAIYRGLYYDETSQRCAWFVPATHPLEEWGDARAGDGTVTFLQPLVQPL